MKIYGDFGVVGPLGGVRELLNQRWWLTRQIDDA